MSSKILIVATVALSFTGSAIAAPAASPTITLCTGSLSPRAGCVDLPVVSDNCVSFTGGLTFLDKGISNAAVPGGFICTLFEQYGCTTAEPTNSHDVVGLVGPGSFNMFNAPGVAGPINFNDKASSFSCSPF